MSGTLTFISCATDASIQASADATCARLTRCAPGGTCRIVRAHGNADIACAMAKHLADTHAVLPNVEVTTLNRWALGRWGLYGDGRRPIDAAERRALAVLALHQVMDRGAQALPPLTQGLVKCLEDLVRRGSGNPVVEAFWGRQADEPIALGDLLAVSADLSDAERDLMEASRAYHDLLDQLGLVEPNTCLAALPSLMGSHGWAHLIMVDPCDLTGAQADLVLAAAANVGATLIGYWGDLEAGTWENAAWEAPARLAARLMDAARTAGIEVVIREGAAAPERPGRSPEVAALTRELFHTGQRQVVSAAGDVTFCLPSGGYAQGPCITEVIAELVDQGFAPRDIVVASPDPLGLADELAPRLASLAPRGIATLAEAPTPLTRTAAARIIVNLWVLARAERDLVDAHGDPRPAPQVRAAASDVARSPLGGIGTWRAAKLDAAWRADRSSTAHGFLDQLATSAQEALELRLKRERPQDGTGDEDAPDDEAPAPTAPLAEAIALMREGRASDAADVLVANVHGRGYASAVERDAMRAISTFLATWEHFSRTGADADFLEQTLPLFSIQTRWLALPHADIAAQTQARVLDANPNAVRVMTPSAACDATCQALLVGDLTASSYDVATSRDALATLLGKLGVEEGPTTLELRRREMNRLLQAANARLVLERCLADPDARDIRPAALLEELVDCYRDDPCDLDGLQKRTGLPRDRRCASDKTMGEDRFADLACAVPWAPATITIPAGTPFVGGPGSAALLWQEGRPWSASGLELLLKCPLRWVWERHLPNSELDAALGPREFGDFNHAVLRRFHEGLPALGLPQGRIMPDTDPAVWGALFDRCVDEVLYSDDREENPVVITNEVEAARLRADIGDLRRAVTRDGWLPRGFAPAHHELAFGTSGTPQVTYAGVNLRGSIDRVDLDGEGRALIIDYKGSIDKGHGPTWTPDSPCDEPIPLHSQVLMYLSAYQRMNPASEIAGGLYVSYSKPRAAGLVDSRVLGGDPIGLGPKGYLKAKECQVIPCADMPDGLMSLMDHVEDACAAALDDLRRGLAPANPRFGKDSCANCPVPACPRRIDR